MFSDDVNESWESSAFQDNFIKDYFSRQPSLPKKSKKSKKRKNNSSEILNMTVNNTDESEVLQTKHQETSTKSNFNSTVKKIKKTLSSECSPTKEVMSKKNRKLNRKFVKDSNLLKIDKNIQLKSKNKKLSAERMKVCTTNTSTELLHSSEGKDIKTVTNSPIDMKSNLFQNKAYHKLQAAKFRYLNELLYTNTGKDSLEYFQENKDEFEDYHVGYQLQVSKWPLNPADVIIKELKKGKNPVVIADLGCGEAKIAESFPDKTVHSFDLIALKDCVTACDIAHVPLPEESVDVTVFCLSLMGTNWKEYLLEGHRILKLGALLKIAEIESRIEDVDKFIKNIERYGFSLVSKNLSHKMFIFLNFKKVKKTVKASKVKAVTLKPCLYKKR